MKKLIRRSLFVQLVDHISGIYYFDNISDAASQMVLASDDVSTEEEENQEVMDINDLALTDDELRKLSDSHISKIKNLELIGRIGHLGSDMYNKLSQDQRQAFAEWASTTSDFSEEDVQHFLNMLKKCNSVREAYFRRKNQKFKDLHNLTDSDILEVLKSLELRDYDKDSRSFHKDFWNDRLIVFHKHNVVTSSGKILGDVSIYIKLDVDLSDNSTAVYVSFHED